MGLGKTIQAMAFLAHLAEVINYCVILIWKVYDNIMVWLCYGDISNSNLDCYVVQEKNIWGPFLVVAPASVLNNWADEISRFCPDLKTLPYWGGLQERTVLRKNIIPKRLYRR